MNSNVKNTLIGTLLGISAGLTAGVLLAPKSGKETRDDISSAVNHGVKSVEEAAANTLEEAKRLLSNAESKVKEKLEA